jgi:hypothetical protein
MKWRAAPIAALALSLWAFASPANADPSHNTAALVLAQCDNGQAVLLNFGTLTNRSHQAFVITSSGTVSTTSIYKIRYFAVATAVIFDTSPGLANQELVTCTARTPSGATITTRGFFTSRGVVPVAKTSSRLLCKSYGGRFATGPDQIGALANPVLWVCNDFPVADDPDSFFNKLSALATDCLADGGSALYAVAEFIGVGPQGAMDTTCYAPA